MFIRNVSIYLKTKAVCFFKRWYLYKEGDSSYISLKHFYLLEHGEKMFLRYFGIYLKIVVVAIVNIKLSRYRHAGVKGCEEKQLLLILDLGTTWGEWSASRPGRALPSGKGPPVPIVQEAGWTPEPVWTQRIEEISFASTRDGTGSYSL
jgi:hypothetical protein